MNLPVNIKSSYNTPERFPRLLADRISFGTRFGFYWRFLGVVIRSRKKAQRNQYGYDAWASSSQEVFRNIEGCGGKFHISGMENLQKCKGPVVFISNHMGTLETMIFPGLIAPVMKVTFVVKDSLVTHPIFGPIMRSRNPIVVSRSNSREDLQKVITEGQQLLADGISLVIFPQSTRTLDFDPAHFNSLGTKLASKAGVQVVPVAIKTDYWGNGKWIKDLGPINRKKPIFIKFGEPMDVTGNGREQHLEIIRFIQTWLEQWK